MASIETPDMCSTSSPSPLSFLSSPLVLFQFQAIYYIWSRCAQDLVGSMAYPSVSLEATATIVSGGMGMKSGLRSPVSPAGVLDLMHDS
eukprot:5821199-Pleurochrysis_carterae.AAC.2